ncbi:MAG: hypothetical protein KBT75_04300 [Oleispira antarctica]|nr:hypothetical protein [Oleispira antarctica]MBQ0791307.1 hypothetical protein [Oleispira antarctica]
MKYINVTFLAFVCVLVVQLSGCATYGSGVDKALQSAQKGQYLDAEKSMATALTPTGVDRLLYHMELAVLKHLQGQYLESNQFLEIAEKIAEDLEVISASNAIAAFMTNPRNGDYSGADFEKVFINYYKTLNYMALSNAAVTKNDRLDAIENARIESRRLGIRLNALNSDKGTYAEKKDEDDQIFSQILDVFSRLQGNLIDEGELEYRDDAMAHYLTGITYETNAEYDNARISYQKAATAYEQGYAKQFELGSGMTSQAWFDTVRMMRKAGGYNSEWPRLAKKKLSSMERKQLAEYDDKAQLVVIEHVGIVPQRKEMNVQLTADAANRSLILRPYYSSVKSHREKLAWFYLVYADKSLANLMVHYRNNDFMNFILNDFQKTIYFAGAWDVVSELGFIEAIGTGLRITVPYYSPLENKPGASFTKVAGQKYSMKPAANPAAMGFNEQLLNANGDIQLALARGVFKALTTQKAAELAGGQLGGFLAAVGKVASQLSDAAETRNWLMLPYEVRITRIPLDAGSYDIEINSEVLKGKPLITQTQQVVLQEDELQIVQVRSMPYLNHAALSPQENKAQKTVALIEQ